MNTFEDILEHYGTKGMRWGVRKSRGGKTKSTSESKKASDLRKRPIHSLTNKQLKAVNERLQLEENFNRLNPSNTKKGEQAAKRILATAGLGVAAYNTIKSPAGQAAVTTGKKFVQRSLG